MKLKLFGLVLVLSQQVWASTSTSTLTRPIREEKKWGVMAGIGSPSFAMINLSVAHNLSDDVRVSLGYGQAEVTTGLSFSSSSVDTTTVTATNYDLGMDYFLMENNFRPVLGIHAAYMDISGDGST